MVKFEVNLADRQTAWAQGGPFELRIDPLDCQQVRLQTPFGQDGHINEHGIGYVTLSQTSGDAIKITFDRSDDRDGTMGSWRARRFARWLWEQNPKMKP
ncbi:thiamine diphosphate-binding protein [Apiospora arundinis]